MAQKSDLCFKLLYQKRLKKQQGGGILPTGGLSSEETGQRSAILCTIVECCRLRGIDPLAYLRDVLTRLPSMTNWQIKDVTPQAWAQERSCASVRLAA